MLGAPELRWWGAVANLWIWFDLNCWNVIELQVAAVDSVSRLWWYIRAWQPQRRARRWRWWCCRCPWCCHQSLRHGPSVTGRPEPSGRPVCGPLAPRQHPLSHDSTPARPLRPRPSEPRSRQPVHSPRPLALRQPPHRRPRSAETGRDRTRRKVSRCMTGMMSNGLPTGRRDNVMMMMMMVMDGYEEDFISSAPPRWTVRWYQCTGTLYYTLCPKNLRWQFFWDTV